MRFLQAAQLKRISGRICCQFLVVSPTRTRSCGHRLVISLLTLRRGSPEFVRSEQHVSQVPKRDKSDQSGDYFPAHKPSSQSRSLPRTDLRSRDLSQSLLRVRLHRMNRAKQREVNRSRSFMNRITRSRKIAPAFLTLLRKRTLAVVAVNTTCWNH